jgi:hypothetical protein
MISHKASEIVVTMGMTITAVLDPSMAVPPFEWSWG